MSTSNFGINFNKDGITIDDFDTLYNNVMAMMVSAFALQNKQLNTSPYTPQGQIATSIADIINKKNYDILKLANNLDVNKSEGIWLDMLAKLWVLERKPAVPTTVNCTITGLPGTVLYGEKEANPSKAKDTLGNSYICVSTVTIPPQGVLSNVLFKNVLGGALSCPAGTLVTILTTTSGWDTITNDLAGSVGSNAETDAEFRKRLKNLISNNASGTLNGLISSVLTLDNVIDVAGIENTTNSIISIGGFEVEPHKYAISILGGDDTEIAKMIYDKKSAALQNGNTIVSYEDTLIGQTYDFNIIRPTRLDYFIDIVLLNEASLPSNIETSIKDAIYNNFYAITDNTTRVRINSTTYSSRFYSPINAIFPNVQINSITMASQPEGGVKTEYSNYVTCGLNQYPALEKTNIRVVLNA